MPYKNLIYGIAYSLYIQFIKTTGLLFPFNIHTPKKQKKLWLQQPSVKFKILKLIFIFFASYIFSESEQTQKVHENEDEKMIT